MGFFRSACEVFGIRMKKKLMAELAGMDEDQLKQQTRLVRKEKKRILQALQNHKDRKCGDSGESAGPIGRISGSRRMFLLGVSVKFAILIAFLGSIGAEDAVGSWLDKLLHLVFDNSPVKEFAELICQEVPNEHVQTTVAELAKMNYSGEDAQVIHEGIEKLFRTPHAFNELPMVESLHNITELPQQAAMTLLEVHKVEPTGEALVLQGLQRWSECDGLVQVASQVVVGGATEVSLQIVAEKGAEKLVEGLTTPQDSGASRSYYQHRAFPPTFFDNEPFFWVWRITYLWPLFRVGV
ncbi:hypothetical protein R1sor_012249 [Riccia sorocarpa]|uniref:Uncharacterized protein n=1 Tax=Riccia sorocarpa TaxID=122646 RepID=A0ABD3I383_9MARC